MGRPSGLSLCASRIHTSQLALTVHARFTHHSLTMASPVACLSDSSLDGSIISSLDALRTKFFSALQDGAAALMDFNSSWGQFNDHFLGHHDELEDETRSLVYYFQVTVESVTGSLLDLPSGDELLGELSKELEDAIQAEEDEALSSRNSELSKCIFRRPI